MTHQNKSEQRLIDGLRQRIAELEKSERALRTLIDASPESIMLLDTERTVLIANELPLVVLTQPLMRWSARNHTPSCPQR